jgi:hypothetical protein
VFDHLAFGDGTKIAMLERPVLRPDTPFHSDLCHAADRKNECCCSQVYRPEVTEWLILPNIVHSLSVEFIQRIVDFMLLVDHRVGSFFHFQLQFVVHLINTVPTTPTAAWLVLQQCMRADSHDLCTDSHTWRFTNSPLESFSVGSFQYPNQQKLRRDTQMTTVAADAMIQAVDRMRRLELIEALMHRKDFLHCRLTRMRLRHYETAGLRRLLLAAVELEQNNDF